MENHNKVYNCIKDLAIGPSHRLNWYNEYFVNSFKFHTLDYESHKTTMNSGMLVLGSHYNEYERDYYGKLSEILGVWLFRRH